MELLLKNQLTSLELSLGEEKRRRLIFLVDELLRWNQRVNLTAITKREEVVEKHIVDSLTVLRHLNGEERLLDIGSGGGFPGLPLKIVLEGLRLVSVDAVAKKIAFQKHIVRSLGLQGCQPLHSRIEDVPRWAEFAHGFDVIVSRAFSSLRNLVELAQPCLAEGGRMIAMKGPEGATELDQAKGWLADMGLCCVQMEAITLPASVAERLLIVLAKSPEK